LDIIGQPLELAIRQLDALQCKYKVTRTQPARAPLLGNDICLYVLRQNIDKDGVFHLIVAAKMEKKSNDGL